MSTSAPAAQEDVLRPASPPPLLPPRPSESCGELMEPSVSGLTQAVHFSSGNPRIEETRGIMHLYPEDATSSSILPVGRKPLVCVIAVPNHMTYADFCQYCGAFIQHMFDMRIVRTNGVEDQYSVIIRFDDQTSADGFYQHFNGRRFSSLEGDICSVHYTVDVQYTGSIEHAQSSLTSSAELPTCPVCLERLDQDTGGILTTICNHTFHCSCISKWTDSSCPVCRYCQQQPEKSTCSVCGTSENVWICVICGFVGCGSYKEGHAISHWKETQHCYSLELETQRVWDYVGDNYVHRLIQSKTDGKLVELNFHCAHADDKHGSCECSEDSGFNEALLNSKLEAVTYLFHISHINNCNIPLPLNLKYSLFLSQQIIEEYNDLLTSQLDNQRKYYESVLLEFKEETEKKISESVEKAIGLKLHKLQMKLNKCIEEKRFFEDINENLMKNQEMWKAKLQHLEEREQAAVKLRDEKIQGLEEQLGYLIRHIETQKVIDEPPDGSVASEIKGGTIIPVQSASSSSGSNKQGRRNRRRN